MRRESTPEAQDAILTMASRIAQLTEEVTPPAVPCAQRIGMASVSAFLMGMRLVLLNRAYGRELLSQIGDDTDDHAQGVIEWVNAHPLTKGKRGALIPTANGTEGESPEQTCGTAWTGIDRPHQCALPKHSDQHDHICACSAKLKAVPRDPPLDTDLPVMDDPASGDGT